MASRERPPGRTWTEMSDYGPSSTVYPIMTGETHFPTAMAYQSDAQPSDVATVCSGSVAGEDDIESVLSQEERQSPTPYRSLRIAERLDFPSAALKTNQSSCGSCCVSSNKMGPPLNRDGCSRGSSIHGAESAVDADCGGSLDVEAQSVHSQDNGNPGKLVKSSSGMGFSNDPPSRDQDDCEASVGACSTRSYHSHGTPLPIETPDVGTGSGRRSPGGTIYKGRGVRRYKGRYMNLPLKRFHQNGSNHEHELHVDARYDPRQRGRSSLRANGETEEDAARRPRQRSRSRSSDGRQHEEE